MSSPASEREEFCATIQDGDLMAKKQLQTKGLGSPGRQEVEQQCALQAMKASYIQCYIGQSVIAGQRKLVFPSVWHF